MLYGEGGQKAFSRLQLEIVKNSKDQSLFAWSGRGFGPVMDTERGPLAIHPKEFKGCEKMVTFVEPVRDNYSRESITLPNRSCSYEMTNGGLRIELPLGRS
jgi:hypothetical protein